jgi:hypothetical protein
MPALEHGFIDNSAGIAAAESKDAAVPCLEGPLTGGAGRAGGVRGGSAHLRVRAFL